MQSGKVYVKGNRWYFRYQEPVVGGQGKNWRDRYINLAPRAQFSSASAVEKEFRQTINDALGKADAMTANTMQPVNSFIEHVFFTKREGVLRPSTVAGYRHIYERHLKARLEGKRMCDFDLTAAQNLLERIVKETLSLRSSNNVKHLKWFMVSVFNLAAVERSFDSNRVNPFFKVDIGDVWKPVQPERKSRPTRYATLADVSRMIEALDGPASTAVAMAAFTGLRKSELQALKWEDLKDSQLHVRRTAWRTTDVREGQTKTAASAAPVPIIPILVDYLDAHRNGFPGTGFIFAGEKLGRPLDFHNLAARVIRPALAKKGIPWSGWHGFRRGLATLLYELGTEAKTRQAILRHADMGVTERHYTKTVDAVSITAMRKVQKVAAPKLKKLLNAKISAARKVRKVA
jgi:integrase